MARCAGCGGDGAVSRPLFSDPLDDDPASSVTLCGRCFEREAPGKFEICGECGRLVAQYPGHFDAIGDDLVCARCAGQGRRDRHGEDPGGS